MSGSPGPECLAAAEKVRIQFLSLRQRFLLACSLEVRLALTRADWRDFLARLCTALSKESSRSASLGAFFVLLLCVHPAV